MFVCLYVCVRMYIYLRVAYDNFDDLARYIHVFMCVCVCVCVSKRK